LKFVSRSELRVKDNRWMVQLDPLPTGILDRLQSWHGRPPWRLAPAHQLTHAESAANQYNHQPNDPAQAK
jgi:hypothetical protein